MDKNSAALMKKLQQETEAFQKEQKNIMKLVKQRTVLDTQLNENSCVRDELNLMAEDSKVFKLIGPVLVKQGLDEARSNVAKRIEYINKELKGTNDAIETMEVNMAKHRETLQKLQQQYQVLAAMK